MHVNEFVIPLIHTGNSLKMVTSSIDKGFSMQQMVGKLSRDLLAAASYLSVRSLSEKTTISAYIASLCMSLGSHCE